MTRLDDIQQAAEGAKVCPDCGRRRTKEALYGPGCSCSYGCADPGGVLCEERTEAIGLRARIIELEAALSAATARASELERERALYRKGYEARGKILAAYRTGGRPSEKALSDAAEVAERLNPKLPAASKLGLVADQPTPTETAPINQAVPRCARCTVEEDGLHVALDSATGLCGHCACDLRNGLPRHVPDPRLANALANQPGPRHAVVREALASSRLDGETVPLETEPQGSSTCPQYCDWPNPGAPCPRCWPEAKGATQKPEGD